MPGPPQSNKQENKKERNNQEGGRDKTNAATGLTGVPGEAEVETLLARNCFSDPFPGPLCRAQLLSIFHLHLRRPRAFWLSS